MTDEQEPIESSPEESLESQAPKAKKAAKKVAGKTAKKATRKAAKKAVKKVSKKAAKKVGKKTAKKAAKKVVEKEVVGEGEPERPLEGDLVKEIESIEKVTKEVVASEVEETAKAPEDPKKQITVVDEGSLEEAEVPEPKREPKKEKAPPPPPPEVPDEIDLNEFRDEPLADLYDELARLPVRIPNQPARAQLVYTILSCYATHGTRIVAEGILDLAKGNFGMIRDENRSFKGSADDLYLGADFLRDHDLREGQSLKVVVGAPRGRDKFMSVSEVLEIDGTPVAEYASRAHFDSLTSLFPEERYVLENEDDSALSVRVVDLVAPLGKGQRGLIVAPPRGGKTILLKQIAKAIQENHPESELVVLLLDERPEEVTDFEEMVGRNVFASTFDEPSKRHAEVANLVLERSRRLVEQGKDVVILLDSLTRLARGYNNAISGGPIGSGGISPKAITECRKFFGAARNLEEGGSLTILATCLIETESRMDDVIFEELKGTGNMEVRLDQQLAEQRIYPAIHIPQSGTRNDDRLYHAEELPRVLEIRRHLASLPIGESIDTLLRNLARTKTNTELLLQGMR
jgi:transcription termination factor Rho